MKPFGGGGGFFNKILMGEVDHPAVLQWRDSSRPYEAAIRWVLQNPELDCTVPGVHSIQQIDELYAAVNAPFTTEDQAVLDAMRTAMVESGTEVQLHTLGNPRAAWDTGSDCQE